MGTPTAPPCPPNLPKQGYAGPSQFGPQGSPWCAMRPLACPTRVTKQVQACCSLSWVVIGLASTHSTTIPNKFGPQGSPWCAISPLACPTRVTKQVQACCSLCWVVIGLASTHSTTMPTKFAQTRLRRPQPVWPPGQPLVCNKPPGMPQKGY